MKKEEFFDQVIQKISEVEKGPDVKKVLGLINEYYGFDGGSFFQYNATDQRWVQFDDRPAEMQRVYEEMGGIFNDPIAHLTVMKQEPFKWVNEVASLDLSKDQAKVISMARDFNVIDGISYGMTSMPHSYALNWYSSSYQHIEQVFSENKDDFQLLSAMVSVAYDKVTDKSGGPELTPREKEIITWVARGKTSEDIGDILCLSSSTVEKHIRSSMKKLDALNRTHMIAKAITSRIITP